MMLSGASSFALAKEVLNVQKALAARGFNPGPIDGRMGAQTRAAIRAFQTAAGLKVDGVVGPITSAALFKSEPMGSPLSSDSGLPTAIRAVATAGRTIAEVAANVLRSMHRSERPVAPEVGKPDARDAYHDRPGSGTLIGRKPIDGVYDPPAPPAPPAPPSGFQPATWIYPALIGVGVFLFAKAGRK